ncbi:MAG: hypothetical protein K0V04_21260 [Deltaproteobacteria bacterium]|nr:hypothetical protein [Deltaproteobacteria bacterium]
MEFHVRAAESRIDQLLQHLSRPGITGSCVTDQDHGAVLLELHLLMIEPRRLQLVD